MFEQSESIDKLAAALVKASAEFSNPPKESYNPHFKSRFADLATVRDTVTPTLHANGLAVSQFPCEVPVVGPGLCTVLMHTSGQWMRATVGLRPAKADPQSTGAALTYARRYGLQAVLGVVADDDDDGHQASRPPQQQPTPAQAAQHQDRKPIWEDDDAFFDRLNAAGRAWPNVVAWLNKNGGKYRPDAGFWDVTPEHRKAAADALPKA